MRVVICTTLKYRHLKHPHTELEKKVIKEKEKMKKQGREERDRERGVG